MEVIIVFLHLLQSYRFQIEMKQFTKRSLTSEKVAIDANTNIPSDSRVFRQFKSEKNDFKFINNGLFGYISYDAVRYFEK
jgi:uncharacterized protein YtpQ (UPF0354 family)